MWLVAVVWLINYLWCLTYWNSWYAHNQISISWLQVAGIGVLDWSFWLFATPLTLWVARRYPPVQPRAALLIHLPLSLLCCAGAIAFSSMVRVLFEPVQQQPFMNQFIARIYFEGSWYFLFYWFVIGAYFAVDYHTAYRQSSLQSLQLQLQNGHLQRHLLEARLSNLKVQLRPHFLFNALHSVSALMESDVAQARVMLIDLAELLRLALRISDRDSHALADEFAWLEKYLTLEAVRFNEGLEWRLDLAADAATQYIPCLLIQPLVENALKHNRQRSDGLTAQALQITIRAYRQHGQLVIEVADNGAGIDPDGWQEGYGLRFVRESIQAHTGQQAEVTLHSRRTGGVTARMHWPLDGIRAAA